MAWTYLFIAGLLEISWAIGLKYTEGFSRLWPSVGTVLAMVLSIGFLGLALKTLPVGTAYAIWTGIGAVGTVTLGIILFAEPATALRLGCVIAGFAGFKPAPRNDKQFTARRSAPPSSPSRPAPSAAA
jgi:quaternary ammonium compound-resistance protein SugE